MVYRSRTNTFRPRDVLGQNRFTNFHKICFGPVIFTLRVVGNRVNIVGNSWPIDQDDLLSQLSIWSEII